MTEIVEPEVAVFQRFIFSSLERLVDLASALDEAGLNWRPPAPGTNSVYALAVHTLGNAEENILATLGGQPVNRQREDEFSGRGSSSAAIQDQWRRLRQEVTTTLSRLRSADLDRNYAHPRRGGLTGREVLLIVARHAAEHLGQAELTRDLYRASQDGS